MTENELTPRPNRQYSEDNMPEDAERELRNNRPPSGGERTGARKRRDKESEDLKKKQAELEEELKKLKEGDTAGLENLRKLFQEFFGEAAQPQAPQQESSRRERRQQGVLSVDDAYSGIDEAGRRLAAEATFEYFEDGEYDAADISPDKDPINDLRREISNLRPDQTEEMATRIPKRLIGLLEDLVGERNKEGELIRDKDTRKVIIQKKFEEQFEDSIRRIRKIAELATSGDINASKEEAFLAAEHLKYIRDRFVEKRRMDVNSIEQLAQLIITTDPELWGEKYRLVDAEGNINQANFLHWIRESMLWHHDNDSDNASLNFWSLIEVSTPFKSINLNTMLRQRGKFFRTRDGIELDELREQISREVWLFNTSRNNHLQYRAAMFSGEELSKTLKNMFYTNTFTKNAFGKSTLRWIMTMPEKFLPTRAQSTQERTEGKPDANVGEGVRTAFMIYYHLSDLDTLKKLLPEDASLLRRKAYQDLIIKKEMERFTAERALEGENVTDRDSLEKMGMDTKTSFVSKYAEEEKRVRGLIEMASESAESRAIQARWLGSSEGGKEFYLDDLFHKDGTPNREKFSAFLNIFTGPEVNNQNTKIVRTMIKDSIAEIYQKGANKDLRDATFGMPAYAEEWAHSMTRWTGAAARNDTGARAYDKWTELQLTRYKRLRDSSSKRGGGAGNPYSYRLFKQLSPDLFNGMVLQHDKITSPYQLLWSLEEKRARGEETDPHKMLENLEFTNNAMGQFATVHLDNAIKFLDILMDAQDLDFEKYTTIDKFGRRIFDQAAYQEGLGKFFKTIRNAYSTWGQINFGAEVRTLVSNDPPTYETMTLAEAMFGKQILDIPEFKTNGEIDPTKINGRTTKIHGKDMDGKEMLYKQMIKAFIAAQIYAHRDLKSNYKHYDYHTLETILETLEGIPADIIDNEEDLTKTKITGHFFSHKDIDWIRKHSKTGTTRTFWGEAAGLGVAGFFSALKESFEQIGESLKTK